MLPNLRILVVVRRLIILLSVSGIGASPAIALESVAPGGSINFAAADSCDTFVVVPGFDGLARANASCDASQRLVKAEVRPVVSPNFVGFITIRSTAVLRNDFDVTGDAETLGNTVGSWISYTAQWNGRTLFIGFFSNPTVELAIRLRDLTDGNKVIKGELIWGRDGKGVGLSIPNIPFDLNLGGGVDSQSVSNTFSAVLTRGHRYRVELLLTCSMFSDGGFDVGSECDYMDNFVVGLGNGEIVHSGGGAGWSRLAVKVGLDETEVLKKLDALANHTHIYLTGRGVGHNNTEASTSAPVDGNGGSSAPAPGLPSQPDLPSQPGMPSQPGPPSQSGPPVFPIPFF